MGSFSPTLRFCIHQLFIYGAFSGSLEQIETTFCTGKPTKKTNPSEKELASTTRQMEATTRVPAGGGVTFCTFSSCLSQSISSLGCLCCCLCFTDGKARPGGKAGRPNHVFLQQTELPKQCSLKRNNHLDSRNEWIKRLYSPVHVS